MPEKFVIQTLDNVEDGAQLKIADDGFTIDDAPVEFLTLSAVSEDTNSGVEDADDPNVGGAGPSGETSAVPGDIRESVAIANVKSVAEQPSMLSNLSYANLMQNDNLSQQNAVSNQQAMNQLQTGTTGKIVNLISHLNATEVVALTKLGVHKEDPA